MHGNDNNEKLGAITAIGKHHRSNNDFKERVA